MQGWKIFTNGHHIDTVFYQENVTAQEIYEDIKETYPNKNLEIIKEGKKC